MAGLQTGSFPLGILSGVCKPTTINSGMISGIAESDHFELSPARLDEQPAHFSSLIVPYEKRRSPEKPAGKIAWETGCLCMVAGLFLVFS
jgi:hypothetical protein